MHSASFAVCSSLYLSFYGCTWMLFCSKRQYWCPDENVFLKWLFECRRTLFFTVKMSVSIVQVVSSKTQNLFWALNPKSLLLIFRLRGIQHFALISHWFWSGLPWKAIPTHCSSPLLAQWYAYCTSFWVHNDLHCIGSMHICFQLFFFLSGL